MASDSATVSLVVVIFMVFLGLSAFFSSAETAFTAFSRLRLHSMLEKKVKRSVELAKLLENSKNVITALLIVNNLTLIGASVIATEPLLHLLDAIGIHNFALKTTLSTLILTTILLTFGEITPKTIALKFPEKLAIWYVTPMTFLLKVLAPLLHFFQFLSKGISKIFGVSEDAVSANVTHDEVKAIVQLAESEGILEAQEKQMIHSIIEFSETIVREVMTPRPDVICIGADQTVADAIAIIQEKGHSRIPVYVDKLDNIIGIVFAKDLLGIVDKSTETPVRKFCRDAFFIPESTNIELGLHQMKKAKCHMAIVLDEYGGLSGIMTLEDIIEEVMGEIEDEYDHEDVPEIEEVAPGHLVVDAGMNINDFCDHVKFECPSLEDYDTIGGFVLSLFGKFPNKNESITYGKTTFIVKEIRNRRILKLDVKTVRDVA